MEESAEQRNSLGFGHIDLVAAAAHELKSPLTLISGLTQMLHGGHFGELSSEQKSHVRKIDNVSQRLSMTIEGMLHISKLHHERMIFKPQPVQPQLSVDEVLDELKPHYQARKIKVRHQRRRTLPPLFTSPLALHLMVYNLVDNAIKYSPENTTVTIKYRIDHGGVTILVSDQGVGIKHGEVDKLFERFTTSSQPVARNAGSSGFGLFIVKRLADHYGGSVNAQSLSKGSCFSVKIPIAQQLSLF